jgi:carbon monoxide dehydrogenase subunit G
MKLEGTTHISVPRDKAFAYFTNATFVADCAPGVKGLEVVEPDKKFKVIAGVGFGAVKVSFDTFVEFLDKHPNDSAAIKANGKAPGSNVDVTAYLNFVDAPEGGTTLNWVADANISGAIASVAMRLLGSVTQKLSGQFFECAKGRIENPNTELFD